MDVARRWAVDVSDTCADCRSNAAGSSPSFAWLSDLADVPEDASPPLMMSPVPDDAVCSYGWSGCTHTTGPAVAWIERQFRCKLRWWQRLSTVRQLEHREDGTLCFGKKVESAPRRSGKSYGMRGVTVWRMEFGAQLFGEVQTVIHTGSDVAICREIQRGAWRWAESRDWTVTRGNGKEAIETPTEDRWMVKAQDYFIKHGGGGNGTSVRNDARPWLRRPGEELSSDAQQAIADAKQAEREAIARRSANRATKDA